MRCSLPITTVVDNERDDVCNDRAWPELDDGVATWTTPSDAVEQADVYRPDTRRADGFPGWKAAPLQAVQASLVLELAQRTRRGAECWAGQPPQPFFSRLPLALDTHGGEKGLGDQSQGDVPIIPNTRSIDL